jgi:hypothetical protein
MSNCSCIRSHLGRAQHFRRGCMVVSATAPYFRGCSSAESCGTPTVVQRRLAGKRYLYKISRTCDPHFQAGERYWFPRKWCKKRVGTFLRDQKPWRKVVQCCATLANHPEMNMGVKIRRIEAAVGHQTRNRSGERSLSILSIDQWQNLPNQELPFTCNRKTYIFFTPSTFGLTNS